ncbi:MAG TPA: type III-B CRISPR module RAMP protein Cmr4, partial [Edaphobacter sp.]|nr:type III-B CRISPR module RAMP protein Cmr4 [Edaphobacter sp.]
MKTKPYLVHALSPLHAGTGHAADIIDLPTVRMKATGIPFVPGSTIKGVLREAYRTNPSPRLEAEEAIFGPARNPEAHAGALVVGDARLLALPVRSFKGTFAWVTSPLLLTLAERDLDAAKRS